MYNDPKTMVPMRFFLRNLQENELHIVKITRETLSLGVVMNIEHRITCGAKNNWGLMEQVFIQ